jgi:DNA repair protein RadC
MKNAAKSLTSTVAEVELVYRHRVPATQRPKVMTSQSAYEILRAAWDEDKICLLEQFRILILDRSNRVMAVSLISTGGMTGTVVDPKIVFATALKVRGAALILAHNHPSGNTTPSAADLQLTKNLKGGGQLLEMPVLDHLIITADGYYSMADEGAF